MYQYIIIYNAESDFIRVYTEDQARDQIAALIKDGYAEGDIEVLKAVQIPFDVKSEGVKITLEINSKKH